MAFRFSRAYVEYIHDEIVPLSVEPGDEPVNPKDYRDHGLIESACARPFHTAFEQDIFPTIFEKSAAFFHSLVCNHCFHNGNKRTALAALDMFLTANNFFLELDNDEAYELARRTARHNQDGRHVDDVLRELVELLENRAIPIEDLLDPEIAHIENIRELYERYAADAIQIRQHPLNRQLNEES